MDNPFFELHREFRSAGARVLLSSGQACVLYGISTFSKDGDWILAEEEQTFERVLQVLAQKGAHYRLGAPLDLRWHLKGWTSHFEYRTPEGFRLRADFCSRPPRVGDLDALWRESLEEKGHEVVDVERLILLKMTRRVRDYAMIGALAQIAGLERSDPGIALRYLQDYNHLKEATARWPEEARACRREAVRRIVEGGSRDEVVAAIALEQDELLRRDAQRVEALKESSAGLRQEFMKLRDRWRAEKTPLFDQHKELLEAAEPVLERMRTNG